jgi:hypothetical protein
VIRLARSGLGGPTGRCSRRVAACYARFGSMKEQSNDLTLWVAKLTAVFCSLAAAVYAATQGESSPAVALFLSSGPLLAVIIWLQKDARRTGVGTVQDWGYFLWLAWPAVIPWYAFNTRGRSGRRLTAGLFGLIGAADRRRPLAERADLPAR